MRCQNLSLISLTTGLITIVLGISACNLEKEITIELPPYNSRISLECYLEAGGPFLLSLTKTAPYFENFPTLNDQFLENILEDSASVVIRHKGVNYPLQNTIFFNPFTGKLYNYIALTPVPEDYTSDFVLEITTKSGKTITAKTRLLPKVPIDSVVVQFAENDTLARVLTYLNDDPATVNYYRRMLHAGNLDSVPQQDFTTDDRFVTNGRFVFGTSYDFVEGDTIINTLYHIDRAYFDYFESVQTAFFSNGNPFGQPSPINSNLSGTANAIGIFTGLSYDRVFTIIRR